MTANEHAYFRRSYTEQFFIQLYIFKYIQRMLLHISDTIGGNGTVGAIFLSRDLGLDGCYSVWYIVPCAPHRKGRGKSGEVRVESGERRGERGEGDGREEMGEERGQRA